IPQNQLSLLSAAASTARVRHDDVAALERNGVSSGRPVHRHHRDDIPILILHLDPEAIDARTRLVAVFDVDDERMVADRLGPVGFQVGGLAAEAGPAHRHAAVLAQRPALPRLALYTADFAA